MTTRLNPYITFPGTARAAMEHYQRVLGGELRLNTFGEYGDPAAPNADGVMHALLETPAGFTLMASDAPPGMAAPEGSSISVSLSGDDEAELRRYWDGLAEGGTIGMPLDKQVWGDVFGMLTDRFGVQWMVNIGQPAG
jgi:PhnB protein